MSQQLLFSSEDQFLHSFENFYSGDNEHVLTAVKSLVKYQEGFTSLYLYGQSGSGKSHLLKSAVYQANMPATYLDLSIHPERMSTLNSVEPVHLLALDNFEAIHHHESPMMLVYETLKLNAGKLLIAANCSPRALDLKLNDLTSRLLAGPVFELKMLDDEQKAHALKLRARRRGFELTEEVIHYVISRYPRDMKTLFGLLDKFDDASLRRQRKITIPFIKELEH